MLEVVDDGGKCPPCSRAARTPQTTPTNRAMTLRLAYAVDKTPRTVMPADDRTIPRSVVCSSRGRADRSAISNSSLHPCLADVKLWTTLMSG